MPGDVGCSALLGHWSKVFEAANTCSQAQQNLILAGVPKLEVTCWTLDFNAFEAMILKRRSSAPGPDGISFGCLKAARKNLIPVLYETYLKWINGEELPKAWNIAWLWLLPKGGDRNEDAPGYRRPKDTRPLSGSDVCAKTFPAAITAITEGEEATDKAVTLIQEGFIRGRRMLKNVNQAESQAYLYKQQFEAATMLFLDFAAAFPSLCRGWIFAVLYAMGIPTNVVKAFWNLYCRNFHIYRDGGKIRYAFRGDACVRQGCPASATIFAWCSHPILCFLQSNIRPQCFMKAYADDLLFDFAEHLERPGKGIRAP